MPRTKIVDDELDSDIGGRVQRAVSLPRFLDNKINRALRQHKRFEGNRSRLTQIALERYLRDLEQPTPRAQ